MALDPRVKLRSFYDKCVNGMINGKISIETRYYVQAQLDKDMLADYMAECGVSTPEEIDYNNPVVAVAHLLHDPLYRHYIIRGNAEKKKIVYDLMTPEMLDVYFNYEMDGARFCDLEDKRKSKADKKRYKKNKKNETK